MGHPPISKIAKGFRLHPSLRNEANNIDSLFHMQAKKIKKSTVEIQTDFTAFSASAKRTIDTKRFARFPSLGQCRAVIYLERTGRRLLRRVPDSRGHERRWLPDINCRRSPDGIITSAMVPSGTTTLKLNFPSF